MPDWQAEPTHRVIPWVLASAQGWRLRKGGVGMSKGMGQPFSMPDLAPTITKGKTITTRSITSS